MLVEIVELLFILFPRTEDSETFEVHEFPSHGIDLFVQITTKFPNKKSGFGIPGNVFNDKFLKNLRT